ncbi:MAG: hypothetical protein MRJ92_13135 [Nitrospira sp.]|nr:hypothetical protein [Nitrospira sp.]
MFHAIPPATRRIREVLAQVGHSVEAVRLRMLSLEDVFVSRVMALERAAQKEARLNL